MYEITMEIYAKYYYKIGFNVTNIQLVKQDFHYDGEVLHKSPSHEWKPLRFTRQTITELISLNWEAAIGVGTVLGFNRLRAIDIDGCENDLLLVEILKCLGLPTDYDWTVRTGSGYHIIFYADNHDFPVAFGKIKTFAPKVKYNFFDEEAQKVKDRCGPIGLDFKWLELRWFGHLVLPPSLHQTLRKYAFLKNEIPVEPPMEVGNSSLDYMIEMVCSNELLTDAGSERYLDFGDEELTKDLSLIDFDKNDYVSPFILVFDLETNGLPFSINERIEKCDLWPRVVQIAWNIYDGIGNKLESCNYIIKPEGFEVSPESEKIHKISQNHADIYGVLICDVLRSFQNRLKFSDYVVGHNVDFDIKVIQSEFYRNEIFTSIGSITSICTMKSSINLVQLEDKFGKNKWPSLQELYYFFFGDNYYLAHNALADVNATSKCFWELVKSNIIDIKKPCL